MKWKISGNTQAILTQEEIKTLNTQITVGYKKEVTSSRPDTKNICCVSDLYFRFL